MNLGFGCRDDVTADTGSTFVFDYEPAACGRVVLGLPLESHLTEADQAYESRLEALDFNELPRRYYLSALNELDLSLIKYMLDRTDVDVLITRELAEMGPIGKAVLLALGSDPVPDFSDYKELRRGLYLFYNCSRGHPARLEDFIRIYGDYRTWPSSLIEDSHPKIYPPRIHNNDAEGIYLAETIRDGEVHETEILLKGYRQDNALEFLTYLPNGYLSNRGEFRTGNRFVVAASPYTCMSCHLDRESNEFNVVFPQIDLSNPDP